MRDHRPAALPLLSTSATMNDYPEEIGTVRTVTTTRGTTAHLGLRAGARVRVNSKAEIEETLDAAGKTRGVGSTKRCRPTAARPTR